MTNLNFMDFNEAKETNKAFLLECPQTSKTFWVQKRWVREDGSLTPSAVKAFSEATTQEQQKEASEKAKYASATFLKETEKAVMFSAEFYKGLGAFEANVWCPKSLLKNGEVPLWVAAKKADEMSQGHARCSFMRII